MGTRWASPIVVMRGFQLPSADVAAAASGVAASRVDMARALNAFAEAPASPGVSL